MPAELTDTVFSWNQSALAGGNMSGSPPGSMVANLFGYNSEFLFIALTLMLIPEMREFHGSAIRAG